MILSKEKPVEMSFSSDQRISLYTHLSTGGEGDDRGWDGWMASLTRWMWVWVNSGSWWWTGRPGVLQFMGSQRIGHDWATELNWTPWLMSRPYPKFLLDVTFQKSSLLKICKCNSYINIAPTKGQELLNTWCSRTANPLNSSLTWILLLISR